MDEKTFWLNRLSEIKGGTITQVFADDARDEEFGNLYFGFLVQMPDKTEKVVWILSDEEGNDGGRFDIIKGD